jgi:hypothetical protein
LLALLVFKISDEPINELRLITRKIHSSSVLPIESAPEIKPGFTLDFPAWLPPPARRSREFRMVLLDSLSGRPSSHQVV